MLRSKVYEVTRWHPLFWQVFLAWRWPPLLSRLNYDYECKDQDKYEKVSRFAVALLHAATMSVPMWPVARPFCDKVFECTISLSRMAIFLQRLRLHGLVATASGVELLGVRRPWSMSS